MKIRKHGVLFITVSIVVPFTWLAFFSAPDFSHEQILQQKIVELQERLHHAEVLNQERRKDVLTLRQQFSLIMGLENRTGKFAGQTLSKETQHLLFNMSGTSELHLPSIYYHMPHLLNNPNSLQPAIKVSQGRTGVSVVMGIPTIKRNVRSYLMETLHSLLENLNDEEKRDCVIIVFIAESDLAYVKKQAQLIEENFYEHVNSGVLEIIAPPAGFYPNFDNIKQTLGDTKDRVKWRTKQNLDFSFLMMYAQPKGTFYAQLEDDIVTKAGYLTAMNKFALSQPKEDWFMLEFSRLGFIGKLFKSRDLPLLVEFLLMFHQEKPVDWLLDHIFYVKVCIPEKDAKHCAKTQQQIRIRYKPSLFQHIGTHSSLKGKIQKLKDKDFGKVELHRPHSNPSAEVTTTLKVYQQFSLAKAYKGETYFWALLPQPGDTVTFKFTPPLQIERYYFKSGNSEHPADRFYNTTVEILPEKGQSLPSYYPLLSDGYYVTGNFSEGGTAQGILGNYSAEIREIRLRVHSESESWVILSEIWIKPVIKDFINKR